MQSKVRRAGKAGYRSLRCAAWLAMAAGLMLAAVPEGRAQAAESACDARGSLHQVDELLRQHRQSQAKILLERMRKCGHLSQLETFNLAWDYGKIRDFRTALSILATVDGNVPDPQTHAYAVALGNVELGDYPSAIRVLKVLRDRHALNADCANLLAVSYAKAGRYQEAYGILREQLQAHPQDLYSYLNLITLLSDAGQFAEAQKVATETVAVFPRNAEVLIVRGATDTLLGQLSEARRDFSSAVSLAPRNPHPRFFLALTDYRLNNYASAEADLRTAMQAGVNSADLEYLLAESMLKIDPAKPAEAIAELNEAIHLDENSVPARTLRGKLYLEQGSPQKAVADLEIAHRDDPGMRSAAYNLARAYFAVGRRNEAQALYRQLQTQTTDAVTDLSNQRIRQVLSGGSAGP